MSQSSIDAPVPFQETLKLCEVFIEKRMAAVGPCSLSKFYNDHISSSHGGSLSKRRRKVGSKKEKTGSFYTPPDLIAFVVKESLDRWVGQQINKFKSSDSKKAPIELINALLNLKILDPAVGTGLFLLGCREYLRENLPAKVKKISNKNRRLYKNNEIIRKSGILENDATLSGSKWDIWILNNMLWGVDIDKEVLYFAKHIVCCDIKKEVRLHLLSADSLSMPFRCSSRADISWDSWIGEKGRKWDIIIGNPPWGIQYPSRGNNADFSLCNGESALAFLISCKNIIDPAGIISFVMPSSWLQSKTWYPWRKKYLSSIGINSIFVLSDKIFRDAALTGPPLVCFFESNSSSLSCESLDIDVRVQPTERIFLNQKSNGHIKKNNLYSISIKEIQSKLLHSRVPLGRHWWIKKFYLAPSYSHDLKNNTTNFVQISKILDHVVRGVKTGKNSEYISNYSSEYHKNVHYFSNKVPRTGYPASKPSWLWLAKGGKAIEDGRPTYFLQPKNSVLKWNIKDVSNYKANNSLRNSEFYGADGIGYPSTGKHSPVFRKISKMIFDADYPILIPSNKDDTYFLLAILNSPPLLYLAKKIINNSVHFKTNDLFDLVIPYPNKKMRSKFARLAKKMTNAKLSKDYKSEMKSFREIHELACLVINMPFNERSICESWYIDRFPGMKAAFR